MPQPNKIPLAFAASGDKNIIPESTETTGLASWRDGFPAITSAPFSEGGIAPKRADFNGIFNALSLATLWQQQGGFYAYDATTDYEVGNVVEYNGDLYKCLSANGPSSAVKAPTDATVWSKVMTAADTAATYLPLSGGTLTGSLTLSPTNGIIQKSTDSGSLVLYAGTTVNKGAELVLYGKDNTSTTKGEFQLRAKDGTNTKVLRGYANGTLTWAGKDVACFATVSASNSGYARFTNGVQWCWGENSISSADKNIGKEVTFPIPFSSVPRVMLALKPQSAHTACEIVLPYPISSTAFTAFINNPNGRSYGQFSYVAVGAY